MSFVSASDRILCTSAMCHPGSVICEPKEAFTSECRLPTAAIKYRHQASCTDVLVTQMNESDVIKTTSTQNVFYIIDDDDNGINPYNL